MMGINQIIAQIVGVILTILCIILPHFKKKSTLMFWNIVANLLWALQFFLVGGAIAGGLTGLVATARSITFYHYSTKDKRAPFWVMILFVALQLIFVAITWNGWLCIFMITSACNAYGQWQKDLKILRIMLIIATLSNGFYCLLTGAYAGVVNEWLQTVSCFIALWRFRKVKNIT
ncbi:MAG: YgjV family protein [Clostridiales bacterium]|jgi:hypothetical protein|nr:YgjV family protein [Clostridiales bacterium]